MILTPTVNAHPDRPADLPNTNLTIEDAFTRLGISVTKTGDDDVVPVVKAERTGASTSSQATVSSPAVVCMW